MNAKVALLSCLTTLLLSACATPRLDAIGADEPISFITIPPRNAPSTPIAISNKNVGRGARAGYVSGSVVGGLAGIACGPFAVLCIPAGALIGGGGGALGGTLVGLAQGLPADEYRQLRDSMDAFARDRDPREQLVAAIADQVRRRWTLVAEGAATTMRVEVDDVALHVRDDDRVALVLRATITVRRAGVDRTFAGEPRTFEYVGPASDVRIWLENRDDFVADTFLFGYRHIAHEVFSELAR